MTAGHICMYGVGTWPYAQHTTMCRDGARPLGNKTCFHYEVFLFS